MLEHALTELFEQQASENPPPPRASVAAATRLGRTRRRRRQAGLAASPILATGAVLAIAFAGFIPAGSHNAHGSAAEHGRAPTVRAPVLFSPLRPYVSPGWLPEGISAASLTGLFSRLEDSYVGTTGVSLSVYARGACRLSSSSFTCDSLASSRAPEISLPRIDIGRAIAGLGGRAAYWTPSRGPTTGALTWQYAAGGWAVITASRLREALRMARSLAYGTAAGPAAAFPIQLTGVPGNWRVNSVMTRVDQGVRYAFSFSITAGPVATADGLFSAPRQVVAVETGPIYGTSCEAYFGRISFRKQVIDGNEALVLRRPQAWDTGATSGLCTVVDGVLTSVITDAQSPILAPDLLAHHMRFLGRSPAHWTTKPIG